MMNIFKDNLEGIKRMLICTSLLSNNASSEWIKDSNLIIEFIGKAYDMPKDDIIYAKKLIIEEVSNLCLIQECNGLSTLRKYDQENTDIDLMYSMKSTVINRIKRIDDELAKNGSLDSGEFVYDHYFSYNSFERFDTIITASGYGNIYLVFQVALMYALGIGVEKDLKKATMRFRQCAYWGDFPSFRVLAYLYKLDGNDEYAKIYKDLYEMCDKYLLDGVMILSKEDKEKYDEEACVRYTFISMIYNTIVAGRKVSSIRFDFLESILSDNISNSKKIDFIKQFESYEWLEYITTSNENNVGFNI